MNREVIPYLTPDEIRNEHADELKKILREYTGDTVSARSIPILEKYIPRGRWSGMRVLDSGTSSGSFAKLLASQGFREIYATDIDDYLSDETKSSKIVREFQVADLSFDKLKWGDGFFDLITAWCLVPHLENPHQFIREAYRTLKPGGFFIVSMPHITSLFARKRFLRHGDIERYTKANDHIAIFTPAMVSKTMEKYFTLKGVEYFTEIGKIRRGRFGSIKKIGLTRDWFGRKKFEQWFGHNIIYVLQKPGA